VLDSAQRCAEPDNEGVENGPDILWVAAHPRYDGLDTVRGGADSARQDATRKMQPERKSLLKIPEIALDRVILGTSLQFLRGCPDVEARGAGAADECADEFGADSVVLTSTVWWHRSE
jgi:hypothetical protein